MGESNKVPTNKICRCASSEQSPRRDLVTNQNVLFMPFLGQTFWKVFFLIQFASSWGFQPAATGEFFVELRSIKVLHVLVSVACPSSSNVSVENTE